MRSILLASGMLVLTITLASCGGTQGATASAPEENYWTQAEINSVKDLQELGNLSFKNDKMYLGDRPVHSEMTKGKYYGISTAGTTGYEIKGLSNLSIEEQERLKSIPMQEIERRIKTEGVEVGGQTCWSVFCESKSSSLSAQATGYNLENSRTNLYADISQCSDPNILKVDRRITFKNLAVTQPNRQSYYLAVDSSMYDGTQLKAKDFAQSGGTSGARTSGVSKEVSNSEVFCFVPRNMEGRGWHKGIENQGESAIIVNRSDRVY